MDPVVGGRCPPGSRTLLFLSVMSQGLYEDVAPAAQSSSLELELELSGTAPKPKADLQPRWRQRFPVRSCMGCSLPTAGLRRLVTGASSLELDDSYLHSGLHLGGVQGGSYPLPCGGLILPTVAPFRGPDVVPLWVTGVTLRLGVTLSSQQPRQRSLMEFGSVPRSPNPSEGKRIRLTLLEIFGAAVDFPVSVTLSPQQPRQRYSPVPGSTGGDETVTTSPATRNARDLCPGL